jgi:hypothetical protein
MHKLATVKFNQITIFGPHLISENNFGVKPLAVA